MISEKKENPIDPNNFKNIFKPSLDQLSKEICKILEERTKARATIELEFALAYFETDW
jgi:hypothetical protein